MATAAKTLYAHITKHPSVSVRAIDLSGERNDDEELLAWGAANGRALDLRRQARRDRSPWLAEGRPFRMIYLVETFSA